VELADELELDEPPELFAFNEAPPYPKWGLKLLVAGFEDVDKPIGLLDCCCRWDKAAE
jgi:hypothetical protein